jgi:hypothetical protein
MNPEKMRSEFGKLMYMLMDSADTHVQVGYVLQWSLLWMRSTFGEQNVPVY